MSNSASQGRDAPHFGSTSQIVGRRLDVEQVRHALTNSRLVSLVGPGGIGKTRLACEVAYRSRAQFPDGVWFFRLEDLGAGAEASDVEAALVDALGIPDQSNADPALKLSGFLSGRRSLLVVDNCEHVLSAVQQVLTSLMSAVPELRVLATSREALSVEGEVLRPVRPLDVPSPGTPAEQLLADPSVMLLTQRAQSVKPGFLVDETNSELVIELCRLLEGIPLSIELAAYKLRALGVEDVLERFGGRLSALARTAGAVAGSRHRSLGAMVEWSYDLCSASSQLLWRRLSVFVGSFDLQLAEMVCAFDGFDEDDVLDTIDRLVGQSILMVEDGNRPARLRYRLLAPLREVAVRFANDAGETATLKRRHRDAMMLRAARAMEDWCGPHQGKILAAMRRDHSNYIAAIQWSARTEGEASKGLQLVAALRYHWLTSSLAEGRKRIEVLLADVDGVTPERADCIVIVIWMCLLQGDHAAAESWLEELESLARLLGTEPVAAYAKQLQALSTLFEGKPDEAGDAFRVAAESHCLSGDRFMELTAKYMLAVALVSDGQPEAALDVCAATLALSQQTDEQSARGYALWIAGVAHWRLGQYEEAERVAREALELQRSLDDGICVALTTQLMAWIAFDCGELRRAGLLHRAAEQVWKSLATSLKAFGPQLAAFAADRFGRLDSSPNPPMQPRSPYDARRQAIELALGGPATEGTVPNGSNGAQALTRRELEVARLVERGLSNRRIAEELFIAKRTADGHLERILAKLGFTSRAQVAVWLVKQHAEPQTELAARG
jgi:predicted ATPase/DNA-binding CsgD family transcriptional regulator